MIALPLHRTRTCLEQQVRPERTEHSAIAAMRKQILLERPQSQEEVEREILLGVKRIIVRRRCFTV